MLGRRLGEGSDLMLAAPVVAISPRGANAARQKLLYALSDWWLSQDKYDLWRSCPVMSELDKHPK